MAYSENPNFTNKALPFYPFLKNGTFNQRMYFENYFESILNSNLVASSTFLSAGIIGLDYVSQKLQRGFQKKKIQGCYESLEILEDKIRQNPFF